MKSTSPIINIHEDFFPVETKALDSKNRVTLGDKVKKVLENRMKIDAFQICIGREGDILLRPTTHIPSREAWLYKNSKAFEKVKKGLEDAASARVRKVSDLERFLESL